MKFFLQYVTLKCSTPFIYLLYTKDGTIFDFFLFYAGEITHFVKVLIYGINLFE